LIIKTTGKLSRQSKIKQNVVLLC